MLNESRYVVFLKYWNPGGLQETSNGYILVCKFCSFVFFAKIKNFKLKYMSKKPPGSLLSFIFEKSNILAFIGKNNFIFWTKFLLTCPQSHKHLKSFAASILRLLSCFSKCEKEEFAKKLLFEVNWTNIFLVLNSKCFSRM